MVHPLPLCVPADSPNHHSANVCLPGGVFGLSFFVLRGASSFVALAVLSVLSDDLGGVEVVCCCGITEAIDIAICSGSDCIVVRNSANSRENGGGLCCSDVLLSCDVC